MGVGLMRILPDQPSVFMSMTKRYFTSPFTVRSNASLTFCTGMVSISESRPC